MRGFARARRLHMPPQCLAFAQGLASATWKPLCRLCCVLAASLLVASSVHAVAACDSDSDSREPLIERCSRLIESGQVHGRDLANALLKRANALQAKGDYDRAIVDYTEALRLEPTAAILFHNRGNAWLRKADYARAIADYGEAIRLQPIYPTAFNNRGSARFSLGDHAGAMADYNRAIRLDPRYTAAYLNRGFLKYVGGRFGAASKDFAAARRLQPLEPYAAIWLYVALGRASSTRPPKAPRPAQLAARWPAPIAHFLNGDMTLDQLLAVQASSPEQLVLQHCEALFFAAESDIIHRRRSRAIARLQQATGTCPPDFVEHHAAVSELVRLSR